MDFFGLIRDFGIPLGLLIVAVVTLWRAWRLERKMRELDLAERGHRLKARENELYTLYRQLALRELDHLVIKHDSIEEESNDDCGI